MILKDELRELAERVEAATGHDLELDHAIGQALGTNGNYSYRPYTASVDAAMQLVPEDYDWAVFRTNGGLTMHAWCGDKTDVFGETPALALTAAALRARASIKGSSDAE